MAYSIVGKVRYEEKKSGWKCQSRVTTEKERKKIEKIFKNNDARIFKEKDHWHLTFPDKNDKYHEEELRCY